MLLAEANSTSHPQTDLESWLQAMPGPTQMAANPTSHLTSTCSGASFPTSPFICSLTHPGIDSASLTMHRARHPVRPGTGVPRWEAGSQISRYRGSSGLSPLSLQTAQRVKSRWTSEATQNKASIESSSPLCQNTSVWVCFPQPRGLDHGSHKTQLKQPNPSPSPQRKQGKSVSYSRPQPTPELYTTTVQSILRGKQRVPLMRPRPLLVASPACLTFEHSLHLPLSV